MPSPIIAEIIAIGDELTSGFRLDTNSQWLAGQLGDLGIVVLITAPWAMIWTPMLMCLNML